MQKLLITGGNGDIAKGIASALSNRFLIEIPDRKRLDVSSLESVERYFNNNSFDIVVNAAGTLYSSKINESKPELWIRDINVNLIGTYLVSRFAVNENEKTRIINISSTAAFNSYYDWTSYCASKAGVLKLSMGMVKGGYDVTVMCPGAIETKIRSGLKIINNNIMTLEEGISPIIEAINGKYDSGDIVFYRKGECKKVIKSDLL